MPDEKTGEVEPICIRFPAPLAKRMRNEVLNSPHYNRKLCVFVSAAVREKLEREFPEQEVEVIE